MRTIFWLGFFFCVAAEKHSWDFPALKQENLAIPWTKRFTKTHWLDGPEHPYYFHLLLSKHLSEGLRETPASTRPIQNSKAVNWAMQGTSIFSHVTHPCPSKSLWQTTSLPYTCTKFKYENTPGNDCNIFVLNQIVTYALYILFSLSLHLGLEPIKLKVPFPLKIDQWTSMA